MNLVSWVDEIDAPDGVHVFVHRDAAFDEATLRRAWESYRGELLILVAPNDEIRWHLFDPAGSALDVPRLWRHDGRNWRRADTNEVITGRQNMPPVLTASPSLMVGTAEQARAWRDLVASGEARAIPLS